MASKEENTCEELTELINTTKTNEVCSDSKANGEKMVFKMPPIIGKKLLKHNVLEKEIKQSSSKIEEKNEKIMEEVCEVDSSQSEEIKPENRKIELPYIEPSWAGKPEYSYSFEILKNGLILSTVDISDRSLTVFGRLGTNDIMLEHPSVSRYHAIVQYRSVEDENNPKGFYVYDLESTHGTFLNKERIQPKTYYKLHVGHMLKFGGSTRMFILQGPSNDEEKELEFTVTEIKEMRRQHEEKLKLLEEKEMTAKQESHENEGIDWGLGEDAEEDTITENPFALSTPNEDLYLDDPKKTLRGWFEREGYDLEYDVEEKGFGQFSCKVQLPIDTPNSEYVYAEASVKGKKKEAVAACALEACRILDRYGLLRQAHHESRKRKQKNWEENDYYDSDEDTYLDRTGTIERKRDLRKRMFSKEQVAETYDSLVKKLQDIETEIEEVTAKLKRSKQANKKASEQTEADDLDVYMSSIESGCLDKKMQSKLQFQLNQLQQEQRRLKKLVDIARPVSLPSLEKQSSTNLNEKSSHAKKNHSSAVGTMKGQLLKKKKKITEKPIQKINDDVEDDDDDNQSNLSSNVKMDKLEKEDKTGDIEFEKDSITEKLQTVSDDEKLKINVKGPQWPPPQDLSTQLTKQDNVNKKKGKMKLEKKKTEEKSSYDNKLTDPEYAMWLPPENQSGDGRTHLNAKYGY